MLYHLRERFHLVQRKHPNCGSHEVGTLDPGIGSPPGRQLMKRNLHLCLVLTDSNRAECVTLLPYVEGIIPSINDKRVKSSYAWFD